MKNTVTPRHSAFTLVEILVVLAIIGILAAILFPAFSRAQESARQTNCASNLKNIHIAVNQYFQDTRRYPDSLVDLLPDAADYDDGATPINNPPSRIVKGTGYLKGGADVLLCPDDEVATVPTSSYGAMRKSLPPATADAIAEDPGRFVFNYYGYQPNGFVLTSPAGVATEVGTTSPQPLLRDPTSQYDATNPLANPIKYSLSNRFAPSSTIITHCVYHRINTANDLALPTDLYASPPIGDGTGARDIVLRLDGTAKVVDVSKWKTTPPPTQPQEWQIQR